MEEVPMLTIKLKDLLFRAYHGVYEEERILGGDFIVNVVVDFIPPVMPVQQLEDTLNYEYLFEKVKRRMAIPTPLLETIVMELSEEIIRGFTGVKQVRVAIEKRNPPIPDLSGSVLVSYTAHAG
jgi:dihydroneopterin aldolase